VKRPSDDDVFTAYMNRGGSGSHNWNEHQYFVKAMEDLHRSQQDKMAKVSQAYTGCITGCIYTVAVFCLLHQQSKHTSLLLSKFLFSFAVIIHILLYLNRLLVLHVFFIDFVTNYFCLSAIV